jgi:hypothetical protein
MQKLASEGSSTRAALFRILIIISLHRHNASHRERSEQRSERTTSTSCEHPSVFPAAQAPGIGSPRPEMWSTANQ